MGLAGDIRFRIIADVSQFIASTEAAKAEMTSMKIVTQSLQAVMGGLKTWITLAGLSLAAMVVPTVMAAMAVKDFDANIRRVIALNSDFAPSIGKITEQAVQLSIKYGESVENITTAMVEFTKAGYDQATIFDKMLEPTLQLAIANQSDMATATELTSIAWKLWGEKSGMSVYDMLNKVQIAANASLMDIEDLATAFEYVGSSAAISNISIDEFLAFAGAISQIGARFGQNFGTLFNRMMVSGEQMESIFGLAPGTIVSEGIVNLSSFMEVLKNGAYTSEQWNKALDVWGVSRMGRSLVQSKTASTEYFNLLEKIVADEDVLGTAAEEMAQSIDRLFTSIKSTILAPLMNTTVLDTIRTALIGIRDAFSSEDFINGLKSFVMMSAEFITNQGPSFVKILSGLMKTAIDMVPVITNLAQSFMNILGIISKIPAPVLELVAGFILLTKIMPTLVIQQMTRQLMTMFGVLAGTQNLSAAGTWGIGTSAGTKTGAALGVGGLVGGLFAMSAGMMMIVSSSDPFVKALGAMTVAIGAMATSYMVLSYWKSLAATTFLGLPLVIGAATFAAAFIAGLSTGGESSPEPSTVNTPRTAPTGTVWTTIPGGRGGGYSGAPTTYIEQNIYDVNVESQYLSNTSMSENVVI